MAFIGRQDKADYASRRTGLPHQRANILYNISATSIRSHAFRGPNAISSKRDIESATSIQWLVGEVGLEPTKA
jgi:hypothetical protein